MSDWKLVDTAPHDTPILVYGVVYGAGEIAVRTKKGNEGGFIWWIDPVINGYSINDDLDQTTITHWQPLPEPPK